MAIANSPNAPRILMAGCGKLGGAIATKLLPEADVFGLRRHTGRLPPGVLPVSADLTQTQTLAGQLPAQLDIIIYCLTPSAYSEEGYHAAYVTGLTNLLHELQGQSPKRLLFVSSTGVYGQDDDGWVDENSPTEPTSFRGQQVLQGEQTALASGIPTTIVRFSGIYGPLRQSFLQAVIEGHLNPPTHASFSNRIHEDDAAGVVAHLTTMAIVGEPMESCYLASDCEPARLDEVVDWVREQLPCDAPIVEVGTGGKAGSKLCGNRRLLESGFRFQYPDFRAGYRELISQRLNA